MSTEKKVKFKASGALIGKLAWTPPEVVQPYLRKLSVEQLEKIEQGVQLVADRVFPPLTAVIASPLADLRASGLDSIIIDTVSLVSKLGVASAIGDFLTRRAGTSGPKQTAPPS